MLSLLTMRFIPNFISSMLKLIRSPKRQSVSFKYVNNCAECALVKASTAFNSTITFFQSQGRAGIRNQ